MCLYPLILSGFISRERALHIYLVHSRSNFFDPGSVLPVALLLSLRHSLIDEPAGYLERNVSPQNWIYENDRLRNRWRLLDSWWNWNLFLWAHRREKLRDSEHIWLFVKQHNRGSYQCPNGWRLTYSGAIATMLDKPEHDWARMLRLALTLFAEKRSAWSSASFIHENHAISDTTDWKEFKASVFRVAVVRRAGENTCRIFRNKGGWIGEILTSPLHQI